MNSTSEPSSSATFRGKANVLYIASITPLHLGVGREEGVVDLPVQRDAYGIPTIYSSSLKGALRSAWGNFFTEGDSNGDVNSECVGIQRERVFGDQENPGAINFFDAYMLIFPARSLKGVVIGVTTPFLIKRHFTMLNILGICDDSWAQIDIDVDEGDAILITQEGVDIETYIATSGDCCKVVINELDFEAVDGNNGDDISDDLRSFVKSVLDNFFIPYKAVAIVHDDWLGSLLNRSLIYRTRVRLKEKTKTVDVGPWTEELVPPGTVFSIYLTNNSPKREEVFDRYVTCLENILTSGIFIGGDETVGSGLVKLLEGVNCDGR